MGAACPEPSAEPRCPPAAESASKLGIIPDLTEASLGALTQIISEESKRDWAPHGSLGDSACGWMPAGCGTGHQHSLGLDIQTVPDPAKRAPLQAVG